MANPEIGTTQKETATASFTDAEGSPVTSFPAPPVWATDHPEALTAAAAPDGMSAVITGQGTALVLGVNLTATATNADGTTDVLSQLIDVVPGVAGDAVGGSIGLSNIGPK